MQILKIKCVEEGYGGDVFYQGMEREVFGGNDIYVGFCGNSKSGLSGGGGKGEYFQRGKREQEEIGG